MDYHGFMAPMPMSRIAFTRSLAEAGRIHSLLEAEGCHPMPIDASGHVTLAGAEQGYWVEVPRPEAAAVIALLHRRGFGKCLSS